jgi:hypothetical protein
MSEERLADDAGVTLIELIVYVLLSGIVVLTTAVILINSWTTQQNVTSVTEATARGQAMGSTIERALRDGLTFSVSADGTTLRVRTSLPGELACQGFQLMSGQARLTQSSAALTSPATTWTAWQSGIAQDGSINFFVVDGQNVTYTFEIETDSAPVRFVGEASTRSTPTGVTAPCW